MSNKDSGKFNIKILFQIVSIIVLAAIVLLGVYKLSYLVRDKDDVPLHKQFFELEPNSVSTFFVGNSHSFCSINTDLLYEEYGIDSFMMSTSGQTIAMDYYAIEELIKYQNPKIVYLETGYVPHEWNTISNEMSHKFFDGMPMGRLKKKAVEDLIEDPDDRVYFYFTLGQYHSRFNSLSEADYKPHMTSVRGRYFSDKISYMWPIEELVDRTDKEEMPDNTKEYMDKIVELCKANNIELILYTAPFNGMYEGDEDQLRIQKEYQRVFNGLYDYAIENNLEYHNMFWELEEIGFDYDKDFMDSQHMNTFGQDRFTRYMVEKGYIR